MKKLIYLIYLSIIFFQPAQGIASLTSNAHWEGPDNRYTYLLHLNKENGYYLWPSKPEPIFLENKDMDALFISSFGRIVGNTFEFVSLFELRTSPYSSTIICALHSFIPIDGKGRIVSLSYQIFDDRREKKINEDAPDSIPYKKEFIEMFEFEVEKFNSLDRDFKRNFNFILAELATIADNLTHHE